MGKLDVGADSGPEVISQWILDFPPQKMGQWPPQAEGQERGSPFWKAKACHIRMDKLGFYSFFAPLGVFLIEVGM